MTKMGTVTVTRTKRVVEVVEKREVTVFNIELTQREAEALRALLNEGLIGGGRTRLGLVDLNEALYAAGVLGSFGFKVAAEPY